MDPDFQQQYSLKDIIPFQDLGSRHLLQNRHLHTEPVTQHQQMYRDYTLQHPSTSNTMVSQYAQIHRVDTFQQHFNNREVHQEFGAPPLLATQDHVNGIRNKTCKSKSDLSTDDDDKDERKEYICKFCQKDFNRESHLERHLLIHTGEQHYVCEYCTLRFNRKCSLARHRLTHTGEKPYVCTICERTFIRKYILTQHLLTHTGEKNHMCEICKKCFTTKEYRNWHSENRVCMRKKPNKNTEVANKQEVPITELELEPKEVWLEQQRPLPQSKKYLVQTVAEHYWTTATGSKCFQEQAAFAIEHLGSTAKTQLFVPIDQHLMHMVPQFLNLDALGHPLIKTVTQQNIAHSVPHVLRQIGHQTAARNGHLSLAYFGQAIDTINHTLTPDVYQMFNIGAQSYNHLMTLDLGYKGMDRLGVGAPLESVIDQSTTATHNCGTKTYHLPCPLNDGCHFKRTRTKLNACNIA